MKALSQEIVQAAQAAHHTTGIFASVSLAQYGLESAWGTRCTGKFNYFGIKASASEPGTLCWTHEEVHGRLVACQQRFRNFSGALEAFSAHAQLIATDHRYEPAMAHRGDLKMFVTLLGPVYATDPTYAVKLLALIRIDGLTGYDA